jgi:hypothetical protein
MYKRDTLLRNPPGIFSELKLKCGVIDAGHVAMSQKAGAPRVECEGVHADTDSGMLV